MSEREDALKALDLILRNWDGAVGEDPTEAEATLRSAIDRAYPPEEDGDIDPVGEVPGAWVVESLVDKDNWQRVFVLGMGQGENGVFRDHAKALELASHHPGRRVRQIAAEASGWVIETTNGKERVRAMGPMSEEEARALVAGVDGARVRFTGDIEA